MIQGVYIYRKGGEVIGTPLPVFDDLFMQIDSDNTAAGLYFVVEFLNIDNGKKVTIKLYPKIGYTVVETYISQILRNLFDNIFFNYRLEITVKEYDESGYVNNLIMSFIVIPSIYNSFLPPIKNYYFYYYNGADYDILTKTGLKWYNYYTQDELDDSVTIDTNLTKIEKYNGDTINFTHKQVCEPLLKVKYLNLHTGYYDTFGGWYIKQDTINVEKQIYNRQMLRDTGTRQALPELTDEFTLISYDLPIDQANYIAKSIITSPKTYLIDTNNNEVECVVMNKNYTNALSVVNVFANINLNVKL